MLIESVKGRKARANGSAMKRGADQEAEASADNCQSAANAAACHGPNVSQRIGRYETRTYQLQSSFAAVRQSAEVLPYAHDDRFCDLA